MVLGGWAVSHERGKPEQVLLGADVRGVHGALPPLHRQARARVGSTPTPDTLHPAPYTLHPTPHTLHPTPYTPQPTPYTLHPTPYADNLNCTPQAINH